MRMSNTNHVRCGVGGTDDEHSVVTAPLEMTSKRWLEYCASSTTWYRLRELIQRG